MSQISIRDILYRLIAVQSDTGTEMECRMAETIAGYISDDPYFQIHPDHWGCETAGDIMGRPVIWALKEGKSRKTVVLSGHYDTVETDCYGPLKPLALKPDELKEKIRTLPLTDDKLKRELDGDWMFGRGCGDMKAGLAVDLHVLLTEEEPQASILFTAVCDGENISAGTSRSLSLYRRLRDQFGLDYQAVLIGEPQICSSRQPFTVHCGGTGKFLPVIVAKGQLAHCAEPLKGLNAAHIISEIARNLDLNTDFCTDDLGVSTQPPIVQLVRDLKTTCDASIPEYAAACVNMLFLNSRTPPLILEKIKALCKTSVCSVIEKYETSFAHARFRGLVSDDCYQTFAPVVVDLRELEEIVKANRADFDSFRSELEQRLTAEVTEKTLSLQEASLCFMKAMIEASGLRFPLVAVGVAPPYYPSVSCEYMGKDLTSVLGSIRQVVEGEYGMQFRLSPYSPGMGDISYMTCISPERERAFLRNIALPPSLYDIPFEEAAALNIPCLCMGPRSEDVHQWSERVYLPDVEHVIPDAIRRVIADIR